MHENNNNSQNIVNCVRQWLFAVYYHYKCHCTSEDMVMY